MDRTKMFIQSIEELYAKDEGAISKDTLLFLLNYSIGNTDLISKSDDDFIKELSTRIEFLVNNQKMSEEFIINALINEVTRIVYKAKHGLGEVIIRNETMSESMKSSDGKLPKHIEKSLAKKDISDVFKAEIQMDTWDQIVGINFSRMNRRQWENEEFTSQYKIFEDQFSRLDEDEKKMTFRELYERG